MVTLTGRIERRILVNYRVDPDLVAGLLPPPFRPQLVRGQAVAGICLLRLGAVRPAGLPAAVGLRSENAAHRFAVEWDAPGGIATGVYIPRRDTGSAVNAVVGGRLFPGEHHRADFVVDESCSAMHVGFRSRDRTADVDVAVRTGREIAFTSGLFADLDDASEFFRRGHRGWSATRHPSRFDGLGLRTRVWRVEPATVTTARSSFFDDTATFPAGSCVLDGALLMRGLDVRWQPLENLRGASTC